MLNSLNLKKLTTKKESIAFYLLVALSGVTLLICLIYQVNSYVTVQPAPIKPTNPITTTTMSSSTLDNSQTGSETSTDKATENSKTSSSQPAVSSSESKKEVATDPVTASPLNLILTAKLETNETNEEDTIKTFLVDDPLEKGDFETYIKQITLSKLSAESMEMINQKGEGVLDVDLTFNNKGKENVEISPSLTTLEINDKTYPVTLHKDFKDQTIAPGKTAKGSFLAPMEKLEKIDDVTEFTFTWSTTIGNTTQPYKITILLKD